MPTQPDWKALAEPFPDDEVKHRPGAAKYAHKDACQGPRCRETSNPEAHHQFSYVDARAVAQRLDDVLTPAGWYFTCQQVPTTDIVHGHLVVLVDSLSIVREDFGYPNSDRDEEPLKAAASDALKRCAVQFGIGRHLYEDNKAPAKRTSPQAAPQRPQPAPVAQVSTPRPVAPTQPGPVEPDWMNDAMPTAREFEAQSGVKVPVGDAQPMSVKDLFTALEAQNIPQAKAAAVAKRLYGTGRFVDLSPEQRGDLFREVA
jgi:hypothetical protein